MLEQPAAAVEEPLADDVVESDIEISVDDIEGEAVGEAIAGPVTDSILETEDDVDVDIESPHESIKDD
jgi:hypothetical protein